MEYTAPAPAVFYAAPALVVEYLAPASVAYAAHVATETVGFGSLLVAECRDAVCVGCTFVVIVVLHRRSACSSFSLKILEAGKARLRSEPMMTLVASCERHVHSATIDVGASIAPTNAAIEKFAVKAESTVKMRRRTLANMRLSFLTL